MRYIWIISYIYQTPSAILLSQRSYVPPSPGPLKVLRPSLPRSPRNLLEDLKLFYTGSV